ncbi:MAG: hypothetical protein ACON49_04980 [Candidatus Puniceispirillaceae bacterium]
MMSLGTKISVIAISLMMAGCTQMQDTAPQTANLSQDTGDEAAQPVEAKPEFPSLFFNWELKGSTLIAPPVSVQTEAISACRARGYDTSYMIHIALDGDRAIAEFGCRGAD